MNKMLTTSKRYFGIVFMMITLAACGTVPSQPAVTPASTSAPTSTPIPLTLTASLTETFAPTPSSIPLPLFPLEGNLIAFVKNGDFYFQVGNDLPVKLTNVGEKYYYHPEISPDNKKSFSPDTRTAKTHTHSTRSTQMGRISALSFQMIGRFPLRQE